MTTNGEAPRPSISTFATGDGTPRRRRSILPIAALVFVALCILALAAVPVLTSGWLSSLGARSAETTALSAARMDSLRLLLSDEWIAHDIERDGVRSGGSAPFEDYWVLRREERDIRAGLRTLVPRVSEEAVARLTELERTLDRWHAPADARAAGQLSEAQFIAAFAASPTTWDSVLFSHRRLDDAIDRAHAGNWAAAAQALVAQRTVALTLGVAAGLSLALLGWLAHRERQLSRALATAVEEEARLRAEEARLRTLAEQRREDLVAVSASKDRLVRGFTHDVKNPIGAADGYLQLLTDGLAGPVTEQQAAHLGRARRAIRSALALIGDLLEVARVDSGKLAVKLVPTDVGAIALEVADEFRAQAEVKGLTMLTDVAEDLPKVDTDPVRVRQVIGNLVSNAVKYTPVGRVTVRVAVRTGRRAGERADSLVVEVEDTGPGIPEEKRRLLFQEFSRLDPQAAPGAGLGLAMAARIVEVLGGRLGVSSELGRGSTFTLSLPLAGAGAVVEAEASDTA